MRLQGSILVAVAVWATAAAGCRLRESVVPFDPDAAYLHEQIREIEYPDAEAPSVAGALDTPPPLTLSSGQVPPFRELSLQEAVQLALMHSTVLRDVGGLVLQSPASLQSTFNPAIVETDPRFGVEAALSDFDAQLAIGTFFEKNDRQFNSNLQGGGLGGTQPFQQDLHVYNFELRKRTAAGTLLTLRNRYDYDFNNSPFNRGADDFGRQGPDNLPWTARLEGEIRQPLLQGAGVDFNRIAGPASVPGLYRGVLIARVNTDISLADFEAAVVQLVSDVENSYWELYFAYRDLDARRAARQRAYDTWQQVYVLFERGPGGQIEATAEAQAREQLYRLEAEVQDALAGRPQQPFSTTVFRGTGGVYLAERQLRRIIGLPAADGQLLRPADEPPMARNVFAWDESLAESLVRRVELRRQKWQVKRRELELLAARNYLLPRLDVVGLYRFRGTGHDLTGRGGEPFGSAVGNLATGDFQEWALGVELLAPVGYRQGHAAVRNAELLLARERALVLEQEQQVVSELSSAVAELDRSHELARTNYNRRLAAMRQLETLTVLLQQADNVEKPRLLDLQLDAQRRVADAESQFYRSLAEHAVAIKNVHFQKGSLLEYNRVFLSEGPWPYKAHLDAARRDRLRWYAPRMDEHAREDRIVSQGVYAQEMLPAPHGPQRLPPDAIPPQGDPGHWPH